MASGHPYLIYKLRKGSKPNYETLRGLCTALDFEFYIGPPRGIGRPQLDSRASEGGGNLSPDQARDLESSARILNRVVVDAGGDPIPDDLWPILDERRGTAGVAVGGEAAGDLPPLAVHAIENSLTLTLAEDVRAAAGSGEVVFDEAVNHRITVPRVILPEWVQPSGLICIRVAGDSMTPTLDDGDLILLDRMHAEPEDGQVFVIHTDAGLVVKRLREDDDGWEMASDNSAYPPRRIAEDDRVVGRVAWSGPLRMTEAHASYFREGAGFQVTRKGHRE